MNDEIGPDSDLSSGRMGSGRSERGYWAAAGAVIAGYFVFLMVHFQPVISTPDSNGYLAQASRLALHGHSGMAAESDLQYVGIHWLKTPDGSDAPGGPARYYSRYPPGLPLLQAAGYRLAGPAGALILNPLMSALTLLALYLVCRLWFGAAVALFATAAMAMNPISTQFALVHDAHTGAAFFLMWGVWFVALWERTRSTGSAFAAGLMLGIVPTIRYPEILMVAACGLFVVLSLRRDGRTGPSLAAGVAGLAIPLGALLIRNQLAFGAFWKTGYALTNEQTGFGWNYFKSYFLQYLQALQGEGAGPLFALGLVGVAGLCAGRATWRRGVWLAALILPTTLLYMSYYWAPRGFGAGTMRFLIPTFYAYAIGAAWLLHVLARSHRTAAVAAGGVVLVVAAFWGLPPAAQRLSQLSAVGVPLSRITRAIEAYCEPGSVVIANGQIEQHLDFVGRWKLVDESLVMGRGGMARAGAARRFAAGGEDDDSPSPMQREKMEELAKRFEGLTPSERFEKVSADVWQWAGQDRKVYWVGLEPQIRDFSNGLTLWDEIKIIDTIELPPPPREEAGPAGPGGGAPPGPPGDRMDFARRRAIRGPGGPGGGGFMGRMGFLQSGEPLVIAQWTR